jgi:hypothetical protein
MNRARQERIAGNIAGRVPVVQADRGISILTKMMQR